MTLIGAGGHAKVALAAAAAARIHIRRILDDGSHRWGSQIKGVTVEGPVSLLEPGEEAFIAIGANEIRHRIASQHLEVRWGLIVHPTAWVDPSVVLEPGCLVCAGAVIQPDSVIGTHAVVNTRASVDHDGRLAAFSQAAPGAALAGSVELQEGALAGIGSAVHQGCIIGSWAILGGGSFLKHNVPAGEVWGGVPARRLNLPNRLAVEAGARGMGSL